MKEMSKERIEISGVEYTLFLNRKGIVSWEEYCKEERNKLSNKPKIYNEEDIVIKEDTNPFEISENFDSDSDLIATIFKKLYWIMLYTEHKLSFKEASELYDKACEEYGNEQIIELGTQMVEDTNMYKFNNENLKNLTALRPKKK